MPEDAPHTVPPVVTVATPVLVLLHAPPVVPSVKAVLEPEHTVNVPPIEAGADGAVFTATTCVAAVLPQLLLNV